MAKTETKFLSKILPSDVGGKPRTVQYVFGNGARLELGLDHIPAATLEELTLHGLSQKGGDAASGFSKDRDFAGAYGAVSSVLENLRNGVWTSRSGTSTSDLVTAIARILKIDEDAAQAKVDAATEEQMLVIRKNPQIVEVVRKLQADRAKEAAKGAPKLDDLMKSIGL